MIPRMTNKLPRALSSGLLGASMAAMIVLAPAAWCADSPTAPRTRPQKIAEIAADLGYGADTKHIDAAVPYLAKNAVTGDSTWTSAHPRWQAVCALIRQNLHEDAEAAFGETEAAIVDHAQHALNDSVDNADLDQVLAFFRSASGRRYLELQSSLTDMSIEIGLDDESGAGESTVENLDARRHVVQLWLPIVFIRVMYQDPSAELTLNSAYERFARKRGSQLDALVKRYAPELAQFEAFVNSESFARILNAEKHAARDMPAPNLSAFFAAEGVKHAAAWRAAALQL